jgi:hypothetical protein
MEAGCSERGRRWTWPCRLGAIVALAAALGGRVRADTPPAPPLDMREYETYLHRPLGNGKADVQIKVPTKLLGDVWFPGSNLFLTLDTVYSRWVVRAFCDHWVQKTIAVPPVDKALFADGYIVRTPVAADGIVHLNKMKATKYLLYGGLQLITGKPVDAFRSIPGYDENGSPADATIPTQQFKNRQTEAICVMAEIDIPVSDTRLTLQPTVVDDVIK